MVVGENFHSVSRLRRQFDFAPVVRAVTGRRFTTIMGLQIGFDFSAKNCGAGRAVGVLFVLSVYIRAHSEY